MLGIGWGSAQLSLRLDEAHLHVDSLIYEGARHGAHAALVLVGSHYSVLILKSLGKSALREEPRVTSSLLKVLLLWARRPL